MASDAVVSAKDVLAAVMEVRRRDSAEVLGELEALEPDLAEYAMEELTGVFHGLGKAGLPAREQRRVARRVNDLAAVLVVALRTAQRRLWAGDAELPADADADGGAEGGAGRA